EPTEGTMHRCPVEVLLRQIGLGVASATCAGLLVACAALTAATSPTPSGGDDVGFLEGRVTIGPLHPVEQVGVPPPTPPPELCTSVGFIVASADGTVEVTRFSPGPDCSYRVALQPGAYEV